ncbi:hypothetical protein GCM10027184_69390 [Saccharothrix stipae]
MTNTGSDMGLRTMATFFLAVANNERRGSMDARPRSLQYREPAAVSAQVTAPDVWVRQPVPRDSANPRTSVPLELHREADGVGRGFAEDGEHGRDAR